MHAVHVGKIAQRFEHLLDVMIEWELVVSDRLRWFWLPSRRPIIDPGLPGLVAPLHVSHIQQAGVDRSIVTCEELTLSRRTARGLAWRLA